MNSAALEWARLACITLIAAILVSKLEWLPIIPLKIGWQAVAWSVFLLGALIKKLNAEIPKALERHR
jgi:hypothetical protein